MILHTKEEIERIDLIVSHRLLSVRPPHRQDFVVSTDCYFKSGCASMKECIVKMGAELIFTYVGTLYK